MRLNISTWLVSDALGDESLFPQNVGLSSRWEFQEVYWKCIVVLFFTARLFHSSARCTLFLNMAPRDEAARYVAQLKGMGVDFIILDFACKPPRGFTQKFGNQFYIFDIINYIAASDLGVGWYVLDSDCVFTGEANLLGALELCPDGILTMNCGYSDKQILNGITQLDMAAIGASEGWLSDRLESVTYCGGEFFAARSDVLRLKVNIFNDVRLSCIARWSAGKLTVTEEAHVLSLVYARIGVCIGTADRLIKRMWTAFKHNNVGESDLGLPIWHLPSEKKTGFRRLFDDINRINHHRSLTWWRHRLKIRLGIPRRNLMKFAADILYLSKIRLTQ
jgi:hypothetical protein